MPKPGLREPFATLESDLIETMIGGLHEWRRDLAYPESHSDMAGCIRAVLRKYDVKLRPVPIDREQIEEPPQMCPVCQNAIGNGETLSTIQRFDETRQTYVHESCINRKPREQTT